MNATDAPPAHSRAGYAALALGVGSVALLYVALSLLNPDPIADESGYHLLVIRQFYGGDWSWPERLPMLPTYHAAATAVCKVFGARLYVLRAFSLAMAALAIFAFRGITKHRPLDQGGDALLHFAWHPILFPFSVMVYTEMASMVCLVWAVYLHVRRRLAFSAIVLLLACLIRQSNIMWVAFLAVWAIVERGSGGYASSKAAIGRVWPHLALVSLAAAYFIATGNASPTTVEANRPRINPAQFYLFALCVVVLFAPVWISRLPDDCRAMCRWAVTNPGKGVAAALFAVTAVVTLTVSFRNPHPWNYDTAYLRNWPLVLMTSSWVARLAASCVIVVVASSIMRFTLAQPHRRMLGLVWLFSFLFLLPHSLAEPRYYIIPVFFLNLFYQYGPSRSRGITLWYLALSAAIGVTVCLGGHPGGGVW